jgi:thiosulfate dehydrogenase [quinone] large subunit
LSSTPTAGTTARSAVPAATGSPSGTVAPASAAGTAIGPASAVPVGQAASFTDPASGSPAIIIQPSAGSFVAFSAICTHAGCTVQYDPSTVELVCPCHGGTYNARTGQVLQGPPPAPLQPIAVHVVGGQIRVD